MHYKQLCLNFPAQTYIAVSNDAVLVAYPYLIKKQASKKKFEDYPIGYLHIDFAEVHTQQGKSYLFVAVDRTSKVTFAELHPRASKLIAADFLRRVLAYFPYKSIKY